MPPHRVPSGPRRTARQWQADHQAFGKRDLFATDYVYVWADGIHLRIRPAQAKSYVLVLMGVPADGTKELIAMSDGYRKSAESWADLLRDSRLRGMRSPVLAVGALEFRKAVAEVFPGARHQRCWVHRTSNVLARKEICNAEDRERALKAVAAFEKTYNVVKFPKAVRKVTDHVHELLAFYNLPAEHWIHLHTTHPIESTFATVRLRTKVTKWAGSAAATLAMAVRTRRVRPGPVAARERTLPRCLGRAGAGFERGHLVERSEAQAA